MATQYKRWGSEYLKNWNDSVMGVNAHRIRLKFDGGKQHADGTSWAISKVIPGFTILKLQLATAGLKSTDPNATDVSIDLGCVSFEKDCMNCEPVCDEPKLLLDGLDVSGAHCGELPCGPWDCGSSCMPHCCPKQMPADCCPVDPELMKKPCGLSDMVLTLNGTPGACTELDLIFWYMMGH